MGNKQIGSSLSDSQKLLDTGEFDRTLHPQVTLEDSILFNYCELVRKNEKNEYVVTELTREEINFLDAKTHKTTIFKIRFDEIKSAQLKSNNIDSEQAIFQISKNGEKEVIKLHCELASSFMKLVKEEIEKNVKANEILKQEIEDSFLTNKPIVFKDVRMPNDMTTSASPRFQDVTLNISPKLISIFAENENGEEVEKEKFSWNPTQSPSFLKRYDCSGKTVTFTVSNGNKESSIKIDSLSSNKIFKVLEIFLEKLIDEKHEEKLLNEPSLSKSLSRRHLSKSFRSTSSKDIKSGVIEVEKKNE